MHLRILQAGACRLSEPMNPEQLRQHELEIRHAVAETKREGLPRTAAVLDSDDGKVAYLIFHYRGGPA